MILAQKEAEEKLRLQEELATQVVTNEMKMSQMESSLKAEI